MNCGDESKRPLTSCGALGALKSCFSMPIDILTMFDVFSTYKTCGGVLTGTICHKYALSAKLYTFDNSFYMVNSNVEKSWTVRSIHSGHWIATLPYEQPCELPPRELPPPIRVSHEATTLSMVLDVSPQSVFQYDNNLYIFSLCRIFPTCDVYCATSFTFKYKLHFFCPCEQPQDFRPSSVYFRCFTVCGFFKNLIFMIDNSTMTLVIFALKRAKRICKSPAALLLKATDEITWISKILRTLSVLYYPGCIVDSCGNFFIWDVSRKLTKYSNSGQILQTFDIPMNTRKISVTPMSELVMFDFDAFGWNHSGLVIYAENAKRIKIFKTQQQSQDFDVDGVTGKIYSLHLNGLEIYQ